MQEPQFSDYLGQTLREPVPPRFDRFVVIDLAGIFEKARASRLPGATEAIDLLTCEPLAWTTSASPALIPLPAQRMDDQSLRMWVDFADHWRFANALTYLELAASSPTAAARALHTRVTLPDRMEALLRWFDNRIMSSLLRHMKGSKLQTLLGNFQTLAFGNRWGGLTAAQAFPECLGPGRLSLDVGEERALIEDAEPDTLIDVLLQQHQPQLVALLPPEQYETIVPLWLAAKEHGIHQTPDQVAYCSLGLELGTDFADKDPWMRIVEQARANHGRLIDALAANTEILS